MPHLQSVLSGRTAKAKEPGPWPEHSTGFTRARRGRERAWELPTNAHLVCAKWLRSSQRVCREQKASCNLEPSSSCNAIRTWRELLIRENSTTPADPDSQSQTLLTSQGDWKGVMPKGAAQECRVSKPSWTGPCSITHRLQTAPVNLLWETKEEPATP